MIMMLMLNERTVSTFNKNLFSIFKWMILFPVSNDVFIATRVSNMLTKQIKIFELCIDWWFWENLYIMSITKELTLTPTFDELMMIYYKLAYAADIALSRQQFVLTTFWLHNWTQRPRITPWTRICEVTDKFWFSIFAADVAS